MPRQKRSAAEPRLGGKEKCRGQRRTAGPEGERRRVGEGKEKHGEGVNEKRSGGEGETRGGEERRSVRGERRTAY